MIWNLSRGVTHTNTISSWSKHMMVILDNITHTYQRPPSVGMPRHALRRRMPNSATGRPYLLGGHEYTLPEYLRGGGGAPSPSLLSDIYLEWGVQKNSDFGIEPYDLNETLCVGRSQNYKNFSPLAKHGWNIVSEVMNKWSVFSPIFGIFTPRYNQPVDTIGWSFACEA